MRFEIELPENYDDIVSITAIGVNDKNTCIKTIAVETKGHSGETLVIPENGDVRWETPITLDKTMEEVEEQKSEV